MSVARILGAVGLRLPVFGSGRAGAVPPASQNPSASLSLREDGTWAAASGGGTPAVSVTSETTYGISPAVGTATNYARQDHTHGSPTAPTAASVGALGAQAAASGDLGGNYPSPTVTQARGLRETAGPTTLVVGAVADGQLLKRVGNTIIGVTLSFTLAFSGDPHMEPSGQHLSAGRST